MCINNSNVHSALRLAEIDMLSALVFAITLRAVQRADVGKLDVDDFHFCIIVLRFV